MEAVEYYSNLVVVLVEFRGCRVLLQPSVEELVLATGAWLGPGVCFVQAALYKCRSHNHVVRVVVPPQRVVIVRLRHSPV